MLPQLDNSDWKEAFKYASPHICEAGHQHGPESPFPVAIVSTAEFTRDDVVRIVAMAEGENDGDAWIGVFELGDGRFACLRAWCDYTGWG
jgi:hypothetical protein